MGISLRAFIPVSWAGLVICATSIAALPAAASGAACSVGEHALDLRHTTALIDALSSTKKDTYETSAAFQNRLLKALEQFGLSPGAKLTIEFPYRAWPEDAYNADTGLLEIVPYPGNGTALQPGSPYTGGFGGYELKKASTNIGSIVAQNAFGASMQVPSYYDVEWDAVWPEGTVEFPLLAKKDVAIDASQAKHFREGLKARLTGNLRAPLVFDMEKRNEPTLNFPVASTRHVKALVVQPICLTIVDATNKPLAEFQPVPGSLLRR